MEEVNRTVLLMSGGMDSSTLLYQLHRAGDDIIALAYDYGQRHRREITAAKAITQALGVTLRVVDLPRILGGSALTGEFDVPHGHYQDEVMQSTVVPGRNMIMIAVATSIALQEGYTRVAYGVHAGDLPIYPDCRPDFVAAMDTAMRLSAGQPVKLYAPFLPLTKGQIALLAMTLGVPLGLTWTCYEGGVAPCGACGACVEREEAVAWAELNCRRGS